MLLSKLSHSPSHVIRRGLYGMISEARRFWSHSAGLTSKAVAILLIGGLSDANAACVEAAIAGVKLVWSAAATVATTNTSTATASAAYSPSAFETGVLALLSQRHSELVSRNLLNRMRAYDQLARLFVDDAFTPASSSVDPKATVRYQVTAAPAFLQWTSDIFASAVRSPATGSSSSSGGGGGSSGPISLYPHLIALITTKLADSAKSSSSATPIPVLLLEPLLANATDVTLREATAQLWKRACFTSGGNHKRVNPKVLHAVLQCISKLLSIGGGAGFGAGGGRSHLEMESAFTVLLLLVPFHIKGLNVFFVHKYLPGMYAPKCCFCAG